jgi:ABC-type taurine transport system substrate-binding protein
VKLSGAKASDIPVLLQGNVYPLAADQAMPSARRPPRPDRHRRFLKQQGKVDAVLPDYAPYVSANSSQLIRSPSWPCSNWSASAHSTPAPAPRCWPTST